jgi:peptidyl-prolyl cis-trans isomerase A (cyclophilin A)
MKKLNLTVLLPMVLSAVIGLALSPFTALQAADSQAKPQAKPMVRLTTTKGVIDIELYPDKAPKSVENFLALVDEGFYDGLVFHRVVAGFVIQAGGYDGNMTYRQSSAAVPNESLNRLSNQKWSVAMARLADPDSAGTQFYINANHNPNLDAQGSKPGYTVFGHVVAGKDVVVAIELVDTHVETGMAGVPVEDVTITEAKRL